MAQLFDIKKVTVRPRALVARVEIAPSAPLMTGDDPEGTERVLGLMPGLADHACLGDASASFGEVISDTELAHLLEHVTVELLAQTNIAGDISCGQTAESTCRSGAADGILADRTVGGRYTLAKGRPRPAQEVYP